MTGNTLNAMLFKARSVGHPGTPRQRLALSKGWLIALSALLLPGCIGSPANPAATQPTTAVELDAALPSYWWKRPSAGTVDAHGFQPLWNAAKRAAIAAGFNLDRQDPRGGVITTEPLVSMQLFEPWRFDVATAEDLAESTLHTLRRTLRFEVRRVGESAPDGADSPDAHFELVPKVLVERYSQVEHRITNVTQYRDVFAMTKEEAKREHDSQLNPGVQLPATYWYPVARDDAMERRMADWVRNDLKPEERIDKPASTPVATGP